MKRRDFITLLGGSRSAALLAIFLCLVDPGFVDEGAVAQEKAEQSRWRIAASATALTVEQEKAKAAEPGSEFKDCATGCPAMIVIPAGRFTMGSPENEPDRLASEGPQREVTVAEPFAVSKFEVSFEEWDACVAAARCPRVPDHWGRGRMSVINVSWNDAKQYVAWLSQLTQKEYRLLTEAEWEYAARAGAMTRYSWGDDARRGNANCDGCGSRWDLQQTAPVGSLEPNAFGLYDMLGNVWEWVEDSCTRIITARQRTYRRGLVGAIRTTALSAVAPGVMRASLSGQPYASSAISMSGSTVSASESPEQ